MSAPIAPLADHRDRQRQEELLLRLEVDDFNSRYADILDQGNLKEWPELFASSPFYKIASRENFSGGFPIGIMYCDSKEMLVDRVTSILSLMEFSPRIITHFISNHFISDVVRGSGFSCRSNFLLVENVADQKPSLLMVGQYYDKFVWSEEQLLLKERICVYDSILIQTSIIYPV
jgi:anthranilate 1,2-dioxygenase small subunit